MANWRRGIVSLLVLSTCLVIANKNCVGEEFRIETQLFTEKNEEASSENLTLFSNGAIYDFLPYSDPTKIVIFDSNHDKFYLLDVKQKAKVVLEKFQVADFTDRLRANRQLVEKAPYLFEPKFTESYDENNKVLTLSNERITYEASGTRPLSQKQLKTYGIFANWYAKINATNPRNMPPFARLELNQAMQKYNFIPKSIKLTIRPEGGYFSKPIMLETRHVIHNQLTGEDRKRIEKAQSYLTQFKDVSLSTYHELEEVATK